MPAGLAEGHQDWDRVSRDVADAYFPHELTLLGRRATPQATLQTLDLGPVLVGYVGWGADVQVACDYPNAYEVNMPVSGRLESRGRYGTVTSSTGQATIFRADVPSLISRWDASCTVLGVKFEGGWLDREAERFLALDSPRVGALVPDQLDLRDDASRDWKRLAAGLVSHLGEPDTFTSLPVVREQLASALAAGFLAISCPDNESSRRVRPRAISRVVDALHDDPARGWTISQMAAIAGTSARRLQEGFRSWIGSTPTEYLLGVRLRRAKDDLVGDRSATVSDVAARWGFSSASRFAAAYRRRYGYPPSQGR